MAALALSFGLGRVLLNDEMARWVEERRGMVIMCGFIAQMIGNGIVQTGAYEVYVDGVLIFSKLNQGHMPHVETLAKMIFNHVQ